MISNENKILITKEEIKRLKRALKDKNENKILDWALQFDYQVEQKYEKMYKKELGNSIDNFILTIVYTLHFNESTNFGAKRIDGFMKDLLETIDMFRRGEAVPDDYREQLKKDKIYVKGSNEK